MTKPHHLKKLPALLTLALLAAATSATPQDTNTNTTTSGSAFGGRVTVTPANETRIRVIDPNADPGVRAELPAQPGRIRRGMITNLAALRAEILRLDNEDEKIAALQGELGQEGSSAALSAEDRERRNQIISLRQQLLTLEREDILLRTRTTIDQMLAELQAANPGTPSSPGSETSYNVGGGLAGPRLREHLVRLRDAATSFDSLAAAARQLPIAGEGGTGIRPLQPIPPARTNQGASGQNSTDHSPQATDDDSPRRRGGPPANNRNNRDTGDPARRRRSP